VELLPDVIFPPVPPELLAAWLDVDAWLDAWLLLADPLPPGPAGLAARASANSVF